MDSRRPLMRCITIPYCSTSPSVFVDTLKFSIHGSNSPHPQFKTPRFHEQPTNPPISSA